MASATKRISCGLSSFFSRSISLHQLFVDVQAAGGVDDQRVEAEVARLAAGFRGQPFDQRRAGALAFQVAFVDLGFDRLRDHSELLARGGAVDVDRDQHGPVAALLEPGGQLAAGGGFARALQARHQNDRGRLRGEFEARRVFAQQLDQLVAHNLDDLLGGRERGQHFGAHGLGADVLDQVADDVEVDVGLEQRHADFAQGFGDVFFGQRALAAEVLEGALQFVCKVLKHRSNSSVSVNGGVKGETTPHAGKICQKRRTGGPQAVKGRNLTERAHSQSAGSTRYCSSLPSG